MHTIFPQRLRFFSLTVISITILTSCAHVLAPEGGPKDLTPPVVTNSEPLNKSVNFVGNEIRLDFEEYVKLKDANQQVIISPPVKEMPEFTIRQKSVIIKFKDTLQPNTTYNINFGSTIADVSEGNVLKDYRFIFSTGSHIDSLALQGKVLDAFTNLPEDAMMVMLYDTTQDSIFVKSKPLYIARTDKQGMFSINNIKSAQYKLFALKDANSNYIYDALSEKIAMADTVIVPMFPIQPKKDTSKTDSLKTTVDIKPSLPIFYHLYSFLNSDTTQRLLSAKMKDTSKITLIFKKPFESLQINSLKQVPTEQWKQLEVNTTHDTVYCWLNTVGLDSLTLQVKTEDFCDTIKLALKSWKPTKIPGKKPTPAPKFNYTFNVKSSAAFDLFKPLTINFLRPLKEYDFSKILITDIQDTSHIALITPQFSFIDSVKRKFMIDYKWKESTKYRVVIMPQAFTDVLGFSNDTIDFKISAKSADTYGNLKINVTTTEKASVIQLLDDKDHLIQERKIMGSGQVSFDYITPAEYKLKVIKDSNANGKWDTGDYLSNTQPERTFMYPNKITVRSNWDNNIDWTY